MAGSDFITADQVRKEGKNRKSKRKLAQVVKVLVEIETEEVNE